MVMDWLKNLTGSANTVQGSRRNERIDAEVWMIAERYSRPPHSGLLYDEVGREWLVIPNYAIPNRFQERRCDLLIRFPEDYPATPPLGFYLSKRLHLLDGGQDPHLTGAAYYGAADLSAHGWYWYCVRIDMSGPGRWRPGADPRQSDNLWTFLTMVRESLSNSS
jgi:hypothetical protein